MHACTYAFIYLIHFISEGLNNRYLLPDLTLFVFLVSVLASGTMDEKETIRYSAVSLHRRFLPDDRRPGKATYSVRIRSSIHSSRCACWNENQSDRLSFHEILISLQEIHDQLTITR